MPWRMEYESAPADESLAVSANLPTEFVEDDMGYRDARGPHATHMHYCPKCGGWIEGHANQFREDTLGPLCGRRGTTYHCRRCGYEIGFTGCMA